MSWSKSKDAVFIDSFANVVGEMDELAAYGLAQADFREALRKLRDRKTVILPNSFQSSDVTTVVDQLCSRCSRATEVKLQAGLDGGRNTGLLDH